LEDGSQQHGAFNEGETISVSPFSFSVISSSIYLCYGFLAWLPLLLPLLFWAIGYDHL
jgi:hypothetical protein